jgi:acetyl-CoA decarbonylase/synthase complex subunit gamma
MAIAQKKTSLDKCPDASEQARQTLAASAAPPMRQVTFGPAGAECRMGQETVLFRHEEKFYSPTVLAIALPDDAPEAVLREQAAAVAGLVFERVGQTMAVDAIAVTNPSGDAAKFAAAAEAAKAAGKALILCTSSATAMKSALEKTRGVHPLLCGATDATAAEMAALAAGAKCPLVASAPTIDALAGLTEKLKAAGCEDLVLHLDVPGWADLAGLTKMRQLALKKQFRPLGYPTLAIATDGSAQEQALRASTLVCKYAGAVIVQTADPAAILPVLTTRQNIYTDPQKPVQVEPKLYAVGDAGPASPVLFTTNFSLTYYTVQGDVEAARMPCWILCVDTEGTSVLTAYSGDKLNEKTVAKAMKAADLESKVTHRKLIIPGYVAVMSGKLEEETGWEVLVGPRESSVIPRYLRETWTA